MRRRITLTLLVCVIAAGCDDLTTSPEELPSVRSDGMGGVWTPGPPLPFTVPVQSGVEYDSSAFIVGRAVFDIEPMGLVLRLNADERWSLLPFVPFPGSRFDAVVVADTLFIVGHTASAVGLFAWSPTVRTWVERPSPPGGALSAPVTLNDRLYLVGGAEDPGTFVYSPASGVWAEMSGAPTSRMDPMAFAVGNRIFLFGSPASGSTPLEVLDTDLDLWEKVGTVPLKETYALTGRLGNRLHFLGGLESLFSPPGTSHFAFDLGNFTWDTLPAIPTPRAGGAGFNYGDAIYLIGGEVSVVELTPRPDVSVDRYHEPN